MLPPRYLRVVVSPQLELFTARKLKDMPIARGSYWQTT